jgi:hypothetical protein
MAEAAAERIAPVGGAVRKVAGRLRDVGWLEIRTVETTAAHVHGLARVRDPDACGMEAAGEGGIDGRLDHRNVVAGDRFEDARRRRCRPVERHAERSEFGNVLRRNDPDAIAPDRDDGPGTGTAFAVGSRDHDDGSLGQPFGDGGRGDGWEGGPDRPRGGAENRSENGCDEARGHVHGSELAPSEDAPPMRRAVC